MKARAKWIDPTAHEIVKFLPSMPPDRGESVLVDGLRHRVVRAKVEWSPGPDPYTRNWKLRKLKVRPVHGGADHE